MGEVVNFPGTETAEPSDIWQTLIYRWWMDEYYPMFEEAGKIKRSYITYGNLIETMMELAQEEYIEYKGDDDEGYQMAMLPEIHQMIHEAIITSFNMSKTDEEINQQLD